VNPLREIWILVVRELRKSFRSIKGILLLILTVLGGGLFAHLLAQSDAVRKQRMADQEIMPEMILEAKRQMLGWWFTNVKTGEHVGNAPFLLTVVFIVSLWLVPAVVLILGFDNVTGDLQYRSIRYWATRTRRSTYVAGKFFGLWATCSIVALAMHALIWLVVIVRGEATFGETLGWGLRFWLASLPILSMWCGVTVLLSSLFRTPILALLLTGGVFFIWWLVYIAGWWVPHVQALEVTNRVGSDAIVTPAPTVAMYLFPNFHDRLVLSPLPSEVLLGLAIAFGFAATCIAGGSLIVSKRDI
jgi:ABC-type transport system involved in multi-copper enzyme maturation permease subunit